MLQAGVLFDLSIALVDGPGAVSDVDFPFHLIGLLFGMKIASCRDGNIGDFVEGCFAMPAAFVSLFHGHAFQAGV